MASVQMTHSQRIGARTAPISYTEDRNGCFVWTKAGRTVEKNGIKQVYFNCSGCRQYKIANGGGEKIATVKFNLTANKWIGSPEDYRHICQPKNINQVIGRNVRRSVQAEVAAGTNEKPSAARVRIDAKLIREYHVPHQDFAEIRQAAVGSVVATEGALYRAKRKKCPSINTFQEFMAAENRAMRMTMRGAEAKPGDEHFEEMILLYGDQDMLIFSSQTQLSLLLNCTHIICDGTFKYAPKGVKQIYRVFGLVRQIHSTPLVTALLMGKNKFLYKKMWGKIKEALLNLDVVSSINCANFDAEIAAYSSFAEVFLGVKVKLCSFHVKQGLYRKVQALGLAAEYEQTEDVKKIVRMIGALQITPMVEWSYCLELLTDRIEESELADEMKAKLMKVLEYYQNTWLCRQEIFCLFGFVGPRTTNHAESYHSKQRNHFSVNSKLGHWVVDFKKLSHTEEMDAFDVYEGRQQPRRQRTDYAQITQRFAEEKDKLLNFLSTFEGISRGDEYKHRIKKYLTRIGRLMGINFDEFREILAEDEEAAPQLVIAQLVGEEI